MVWKIGSGVVIYSPTLDNPPKILSKHVQNYSSPYHREITAIKIALQECLKIHLINVKIIHILSAKVLCYHQATAKLLIVIKMKSMK